MYLSFVLIFNINWVLKKSKLNLTNSLEENYGFKIKITSNHGLS